MIADARALVATGRWALAVDALKAFLGTHPESAGCRRELALMYRAHGHPDQAGRWGILSTAWATDREIAAFAKMIAAIRPDEAHLRRLLALPKGAAIPEEVMVLARPWIPPGTERVRRWASTLSASAGVLAIAVVIAGAAGELLVTILGMRETPAAQATIDGAVVTGLGVTCLLACGSSLLRQKWVSAAVWALFAAIAAILSVRILW
ncbi:anti-sigma factor RsiW [Marisediminicola sp. UYEF4]|uniref:DUF6584 family protein n=1 Tax=Marisediminicola sp. UYEF4 TaxID=1756384 RepID=UPI00339B3EDB